MTKPKEWEHWGNEPIKFSPEKLREWKRLIEKGSITITLDIEDE